MRFNLLIAPYNNQYQVKKSAPQVDESRPGYNQFTACYQCIDLHLINALIYRKL